MELEEKIVAGERAKANRLEPLRNWIFEANQAPKWVLENNWLEMKSFLQKVGSNRRLRSQTLTVSLKKPFDLLAKTTVAVRSTNDVSAQLSLWWRRRELKSSVEENNFSRSCAVRHKTSVNKVVRAGWNFSSPDCHRAPKRTKQPMVCPVLSRPRQGAGGGSSRRSDELTQPIHARKNFIQKAAAHHCSSQTQLTRKNRA